MGSIWDPTFCEIHKVGIGGTWIPSRAGGGTMVTGERLRSSEVPTGERLRRRPMVTGERLRSSEVPTGERLRRRRRRRDYESHSW